MNPRTHAFLASARIANLPSVLSEVMLGMLLVGPFVASSKEFWFIWASLSLAGVLLCLAGNLANDWHDHEWDARHRPERAIPSGLIDRRLYLLLAGLSAGSGIALAFATQRESGFVALAILGCIVIYTRWHKRTSWAIIPLALCRALLPVMALAVWVDLVHWRQAAACAAIGIYLIGLSIEARNEAKSDSPSRRGVRLPWLGVALMAVSVAGMAPLLGVLAALLPMAGWLYWKSRRSTSIRAIVSMLLAALPLLDAIAVWPMALMGAFGWPHTLGILLLPVLCFGAAIRLQQVASAT